MATNGAPLGSSSPEVLMVNAKNLDKAMNDQGADVWLNRFGEEQPSWHGLVNMVLQFLQGATRGLDQAGEDAITRIPLNSVSQYPWVITDKEGTPILNIDESKLGGGEYVTRAILEDLPGLNYLSPDYAWGITDSQGNVILGITKEGGPVFGGERMLDGWFSWAITDAAGYVIFGQYHDGTWYTPGSSGTAGLHVYTEGQDGERTVWVYDQSTGPKQLTSSGDSFSPTASDNTITYLSRDYGGVTEKSLTYVPSARFAPFVATAFHFLGYGQSLGLGTLPLTISSPPCVNRLFMINRGVRIANPGVAAVTGDFSPVMPLDGSPVAEVPCVSSAMFMQQKNLLPDNAMTVSGAIGAGAQSVETLSKADVRNYYKNIVLCATTVAAEMASLGFGYVPVVDFDQGQANSQDTTQAYYDKLYALWSDLNTDIKAGAAYAGTLRMMLSQYSSFQRYQNPVATVPMAQLKLALDYPDIFVCSGPQYWFPTIDGVHPDSDDYRRLGTSRARFLAATAKGEKLYPVYCTSATRDNDVVYLKFNTPFGHLTLDTVNIADPGNYGLRWIDNADGNSISIKRIEVMGDQNLVKVFLSATPTGTGQKIGIADTGTLTAFAGPTTGPRSCFRDSLIDYTCDGLPVYYFACHQQINVI